MADRANEPISVSILDRDYQFTCAPAERAALKEAAELLDGRMREVKAAGSLMTLERVAVMTALNMSDEILKLRKADLLRAEQVDQRIRQLADRVDDALSAVMD